jgi:hypothetical protein
MAAEQAKCADLQGTYVAVRGPAHWDPPLVIDVGVWRAGPGPSELPAPLVGPAWRRLLSDSLNASPRLADDPGAAALDAVFGGRW